MARAIDGEELVQSLKNKRIHILLENENDGAAVFDDILDWIKYTPTLTQPNEPLKLIKMSDELPPDNERILVYRSCMETADTGPWSVEWGWAAKRDGSYWAHLTCRPPEGKEDT